MTKSTIIDDIVYIVETTCDQFNEPTEEFNFQNPQIDPKKLSEILIDKLVTFRGLGLSCNQINIPGLSKSVRVFAAGNPDDKANIKVYFNPKIIHESEEKVYMIEGCLSFPGLTFKVKRPASIRMRYADVNGDINTEPFEGMSARVFQHECEHLNGSNFTRSATKFHLDQARRQLDKINRLKGGRRLKK